MLPLPFRLPALFLVLAFPCLAQDSGGAIHSYPAHGVIQHIAADLRTVTIHHQTIPGYMMEMTMDFPVHDPHLLDGLAAGDQVDFTLKVSANDSWVENLHRTGHTDLAAPAPNPSPDERFKPGDVLPDAVFTAEDGRQAHLSDFRGQVIVFTFFFTRCPLPNYCPLMNKNFARTRDLLLHKPGAPKNWQFLSISFDADFDQPQTLRAYGDFYRNQNRDRWLFVAAPPETLAHLGAPLGLMIMGQGGTLSHNLRTVVVDPKGRLFRQFNDNLWTPEQLEQAVEQAARA